MSLGSQDPEPHALEALAQQGRVDYRMLTEECELTAEVEHQIIEDLKAYRTDNPRNGQPLAWGRLAALMSGSRKEDQVSGPALLEVVRGRYKGNKKCILLIADRFLAEDRERAGRFNFRTHASPVSS
jgi:hypothetical protein